MKSTAIFNDLLALTLPCVCWALVVSITACADGDDNNDDAASSGGATSRRGSAGEASGGQSTANNSTAGKRTNSTAGRGGAGVSAGGNGGTAVANVGGMTTVTMGGEGGETSIGGNGNPSAGSGGEMNDGNGGSGGSITNQGGSGGEPNVPAAGAGPGNVPTTDPFAGPSHCTSGLVRDPNESEAPEMNPGFPCILCHAVAGEGDAPTFTFAGTLYPTGHEPNSCISGGAGSADVVLNDALGNEFHALANTSGNFLLEDAVLTPPFSVKVLFEGRERAATTLHQNPDCNLCHTDVGDQGAPGRVVLP